MVASGFFNEVPARDAVASLSTIRSWPEDRDRPSVKHLKVFGKKRPAVHHRRTIERLEQRLQT
jgi:hypothetical protein